MSDIPELTILLGPVTGVSTALNWLVRKYSGALADAGVVAYANRFASPILRRHLGDKPAEARALAFHEETAKRPALLSALNFLGSPHAGLKAGEIFPNAEVSIAGLTAIAPQARLVLSIDTLPAFFLAAASDPLEARVRRTRWEVLYELSWADLAREVKEAVPDCDLLVLTPDGAATGGPHVLRHLFGNAADVFPDGYALLRAQMGQTGHAVLDRLIKDGEPSSDVLEELQKSFAVRPTKDELQVRLGLDKVTATLLDQRFAEDVEAIRALPGTQVI